MNQETLIKIKEITEELLKAMGFEAAVNVVETPDSGMVVKIESNEAGYLIGRNGDSLLAAQLLARALTGKKIGSDTRFSLDVNNYQLERLNMLKEAALNAARQAAQCGEPRFLPFMSSYERRIVHTALAEIPGIKTESEGEREERRIVIKPINN